MKVYVIMRNDYPDCVFSDEGEAERYVQDKTTQNLKDMESYLQSGKIYYRNYPFELKGKKE